MEQPKNSQEMNESLDRLHPEYGQYILVNEEKGSVVWHESHDTAVHDQAKYGGTIINTATADPDFVKRTLDAARKNM
jgi:hypothetical protein